MQQPQPQCQPLRQQSASDGWATYCQQGPAHLEPTARGVLSDRTFVFKDLFDVAEFKTGAGNPQWLESHSLASQTSPLINALLGAGAQCVGRVQTDELAYSLNGQNVHYGTPMNPKAPDCLPGGSSSGSVVVVARGEADFSIGTDTGGSVRVPASYCGVFGLRPTLGQLSLEHCFELASSFDTAGIFSRDLTLLKQVFDVLSHAQAGQAKAYQLPVHVAKTLHFDSLLAKMLSAERRSCLDAWCEQTGFTLVEHDFLTANNLNLASLSLLFRTIQGFEMIATHGAWLAEYGESLDPAIYARVQWSRSITERAYFEAKAEQRHFTQKLVDAMASGTGLWLVPTTPSGPPSLTLSGDALAQYRSDLMGLTSVAGLAGLPQLHLPMDGLGEGPCGISLLGLPHSDNLLIATGEHLLAGQQGE
jgi:aspartyl-tRNA(Asn)/glutamyl-tRNA(Gln) amidotransferase subunit A